MTKERLDRVNNNTLKTVDLFNIMRQNMLNIYTENTSCIKDLEWIVNNLNFYKDEIKMNRFIFEKVDKAKWLSKIKCDPYSDFKDLEKVVESVYTEIDKINKICEHIIENGISKKQIDEIIELINKRYQPEFIYLIETSIPLFIKRNYAKWYKVNDVIDNCYGKMLNPDAKIIKAKSDLDNYRKELNDLINELKTIKNNYVKNNYKNLDEYRFGLSLDKDSYEKAFIDKQKSCHKKIDDRCYSIKRAFEKLKAPTVDNSYSSNDTNTLRYQSRICYMKDKSTFDKNAYSTWGRGYK